MPSLRPCHAVCVCVCVCLCVYVYMCVRVCGFVLASALMPLSHPCHAHPLYSHTHTPLLIHTQITEFLDTQAPALQHTAAHCNTLQHTVITHCKTLQHTSTDCNTLQHMTCASVLMPSPRPSHAHPLEFQKLRHHPHTYTPA